LAGGALADFAFISLYQPKVSTMKPKAVLMLPKVVTGPGAWKVITGRAGRMSTHAFPLSKRHPVDLGRNYHWRVDVVQGGSQSFRVLTAFNPEIEEYRSWLAMVRGDSLVVLAQLEFHGSPPGWHCHVSCGEIEDIQPGQAHPPTARRFPGGNSTHRRTAYDVTESSALAMAFKFFNITGAPEGTFI
jgi:hypothetical protein